MLPEEEIALRRALHASLQSKTADDVENKPMKEENDWKESSWKVKRKPNESAGNKKQQKKHLLEFKSKAGKGKAKNIHGKELFKKKGTGKNKKTVHENERGKVKRRRRKNVDPMKDDGNNRSSERYHLTFSLTTSA
jgi:hypothetical protein